MRLLLDLDDTLIAGVSDPCLLPEPETAILAGTWDGWDDIIVPRPFLCRFLLESRERFDEVCLATMSIRQRADAVLDALGIACAFDAVYTREDFRNRLSLPFSSENDVPSILVDDQPYDSLVVRDKAVFFDTQYFLLCAGSTLTCPMAPPWPSCDFVQAPAFDPFVDDAYLLTLCDRLSTAA